MAGGTGVRQYALTTLLILGCGTLIPTTSATRCFRCDHNEASTDNNAIVKTVLGWLSNVDHPACKLETDAAKRDVDVVECPPVADSGMTYVCVTVRGRVTTSYLSFDVHWDSTVRDCLQVPSGDSDYQGCKEGATVSGPVRYLLQQAAKGADSFNLDNDLRFQGKTCYDAVSQAIPDRGTDIQCVTCTRAELVSGSAVLKPVLDLFAKVSNDACLLENSDDKYRVGSRICPQPARGNQAACGVIHGEAKTSFLTVDFTYKTTERGCVEQPQGETLEGCGTELPPDGTAKNLLKQGLDTINLDVKFTGLVCYNKNGYGTPTKFGLVGRAGGGPALSTWVIGLSSLLCLLLKRLL